MSDNLSPLPISAESLPLPDGAATGAAQTDGSQVAKIKQSDGSEISSSSPLPISGTVAVSEIDATLSPQVFHELKVNLGGAATYTFNTTEVTTGKTAQLMGVHVSATLPLRIEVYTVKNSVATLRRVAHTSAANPRFDWEPRSKEFYEIEGVDAETDNFRVTVVNLDNGRTSDVDCVVEWDEKPTA